MVGLKVPSMVTDHQQMFVLGPFTCGMSSFVSLSMNHSEGKVESLEWTHGYITVGPLTAVLACLSSKSQKFSGLLKVSPQFLLYHYRSPNSLVEFPRNVGLEVTSMVIRCLTKMTRTPTSCLSKDNTQCPEAK